MNISIIGGDKRNLHLKTLLEKDGHTITLWGFDKLGIPSPSQNLKEALQAPIIIGPIPFIKNNKLYAPYAYKNDTDINILKNLNKNQTLIGGGLPDLVKTLNITYIDLLKNETFVQKNALPTAEGTLAIAIQESDITIANSNIVIIGAGRIGKICEKLFANLGANVTIVVREPKKLDNNFAFCHQNIIQPIDKKQVTKAVLHQNMAPYLKKADIIISTPPGEVLTKKHIPYINPNALVIDVSSQPYGVSQDIENTLRPHALPGRMFAKTAATYIHTEITNILQKSI